MSRNSNSDFHTRQAHRIARAIIQNFDVSRKASSLSSTHQRAPFDLGAYIDDNTDDGR